MRTVLHLSYSDSNGGAAVAALRLHRALLQTGRFISRLAVVEKRTEDPSVELPFGRRTRRRDFLAKLTSEGVRRLQPHAEVLNRSVNWLRSGLADWANGQDVDVVNLHWVGEETLSVAELARINKPVVWTLHDMWPFCGTEHYANTGHKRYQLGYSAESKDSRSHGYDVDAWNFRRKSRRWSNCIFHLACPSHWIAHQAATSSLFARMPSRVIANGVDTKAFHPRERSEARELLKLAADRTYILFGAANATKDPRKGFNILLDALARVYGNHQSDSTQLLVFGATDDDAELTSRSPIRVNNLGTIHSAEQLSLIYSAADLFVAPSMQDNLPNTLIEAHACGTPCVAFDVGGIKDVIRDKETGCLASPFDCSELAEAITGVLRLDSDSTRRACRERAIRCFSAELMAENYISYYESILGCGKGGNGQ